MSEILKLAIKSEKQRDIYEKINQQHIEQLRKAYGLAIACHNLKKQSRMQQLFDLKSSKDVELKNIYSYALYDELKRYFHSQIIFTIFWGFRMFLILDDGSCFKEGIYNIITKKFQTMYPKVNDCCFWKFLTLQKPDELFRRLEFLLVNNPEEYLKDGCEDCVEEIEDDQEELSFEDEQEIDEMVEKMYG